MTNKQKEIKNKINGFISKIGRDAYVPVTDSFLLEMCDGGELTIKGCHELLTCCEDNITLMTDGFMLIIKGEKMFLSTFSPGVTSVSGTVLSIEFVR